MPKVPTAPGLFAAYLVAVALIILINLAILLGAIWAVVKLLQYMGVL